MEEARRVIERLGRIEELKRGGAPPRELLGEIRSLLREGEDWLAAERAGAGQRLDTERATVSLERCRELMTSRAESRREVGAGTAG